MSLRIPIEKENKLQRLARKQGKTKTAIILEAVDEKLGLAENRADTIRRLAGWMTEQQAEALRRDIDCFNHINEADWP